MPTRVMLILDGFGELVSAIIAAIFIISGQNIIEDIVGAVIGVVLARLIWYYVKWYLIQIVEDIKKFINDIWKRLN